MGEKFHYITLILQVFVPNGMKTNIYFGPFNSEEDAEEWADKLGLEIGLFTQVKMVYPDAIYEEPIA